MNLEQLQQRLARVRGRLYQQFPQAEEPFKFTFAMHIFAPQEQERLQHFVTQIEPKYRSHVDGRLDLADFSREEREELRHWLSLEDALQRADARAAARYRRMLNPSLDALIERFLAIDLDPYESGPTNSDPIGIALDEEGHPYKLYKAGYRHIRMNMIENPYHRARLQHDTIEQMWQWVEWYEQEQSANLTTHRHM
jgi:hypothetical protein